MGRTNHNTHRSANEWEEVGLVGTSLRFTDDEIISTLGIGKTKDMCRRSCAMDIALTYTLMSLGPDVQVTAKDCINEQTRRAFWYDTRLFALVDTKVEDKTNQAYFEQHGKYPMVSGMSWHMRTNLLERINSGSTWKEMKESNGSTGMLHPLYRGKLISSWESNRSHFRNWQSTSHLTEVSDSDWRGLTRVLTDKDGEKELLRCINKGFNRMVKNGRCRQTSMGRGRTFEWREWSWLETVRQEVLVSNSFNRKIGDTINGWEYAVKNTTDYWGIAVNKYHWKPVEELSYFKVKIIGGTLGHNQSFNYTTHKWEYHPRFDTSIASAPYIFADEATARQYRDMLVEALPLPSGAYPVYREVDEDFNITDQQVTSTVKKMSYELRLKPDVFVEDLPTPQDMFKEFLKAPASKSNYSGMYDNLPKLPLHIQRVKKEEAEASE